MKKLTILKAYVIVYLACCIDYFILTITEVNMEWLKEIHIERLDYDVIKIAGESGWNFF